MLARRFLTIILVLLIAGCSGLGGEPRIVATIPQSTPEFPTGAPDIALGARIFAERCTACHGIEGQGDGPLIGSAEGQIPQGPPNFTDPATTAEQTPLEWYTTITNGRIEKMMPPWRDALSDDERWAVALYTYTLHYESGAIERGAELVETTGIVPTTLQQSDVVGLTDAELVEQFGNGWDDSQRKDAAAYLRSLYLLNMDMVGQVVSNPSPAATDVVVVEPAQTPEVVDAVGTVTGQISNGTAGGSVPTDLVVTLNVLDAEFNNTPRETIIQPDGSYTFENVPVQADFSYIVTVRYAERTFGGDLVQGDAAVDGELNLPVTIYELTDDAGSIRIAGMVSQITVVEDTLQIAQVVSFQNVSDRAYSTNLAVDAERYGSVQLSIPPGAQVVSVAADDSRYALASDGLAVIDTAPVLPNSEHLVQVVYRLPYTGQAQIEQVVEYAVSGPMRLLVTSSSLQITSEQFEVLDLQTLNGIVYQSYGVRAPLAVGDTVRYSITGGTASSNPAGVVSANQLIPVALIGLGVVAVLAAGFLYWRGRQTPVAAPTDNKLLIDGLIREIAELDAAYSAGQLNEATYRKRRERLKTRLSELMDNN